MKLLLDTCIWGGAVATLQTAGHDVIWAGNWPNDPGDDEIMAFAHREGRILITLDKDFGELAVVRGQAHAGIIRLTVLPTAQLAPTCLMALARYALELQAEPWSRLSQEESEFDPAAPRPNLA